MPEGPSIVILREALAPFKGKTVAEATGYAGINYERLSGRRITAIKSWGKHLLICFSGFYVRVHLMMFGSYFINGRKRSGNPTLRLSFARDEVNFHTCNVKLFDGSPDETYDWAADIMSDDWSAASAKKKIKALKKTTKVCDLLLDQTIFSGSGNIIKNEVLFRTYIHPRSLTGFLPDKQLNALIKETRNYSFDFLKWKKAHVLAKNWQIYTKKECPRCHIPTVAAHLGKGMRITYFCNNCQQLYQG